MKFLMMALLLPFQTQAALKLAPPETLLAKAQRSRVACREVILDIQQNVPEMRSPEVFDSYFGILPPLDAIAQRHRMDEIYPGAVKNLGVQMTSNGIRWLHLARDPAARILAYHRWMNQDVAYSFLSNSEIEAKNLSLSESKLFAENTDQLIAYIDQAFPDAAGLRVGYRNLVSDLAARNLAKEGISEEESIFWLEKIRTAPGFGTALGLLQNELALTGKERKGGLHFLIRKVLTIGEKIRAEETVREVWLLAQLGDVAVQAVLRMTELQEPFLSGEFPRLLQLMEARHLQSLAQSWMGEERTPDEAYAEHYLLLTRQLFSTLEEKGLRNEAAQIRRYEARLAAPVMARSKKLEGTYRVVSGTGKRWTFTVALARESTVYLALRDDAGFVGKGFFNVEFSADESSFVASEREADTDSQANLTLKCKFLGDGKIEIRDLMAVPEEQILRGGKTESYPSYFQEKSPDLRDPSGTYEGMVYIGPNFAQRMTLVVTAFGGYTLARMADRERTLFLDFQVGTRGTDSVLYLTTGRMKMGWLQLRGVIKNGEYRGFTVSGGRGLSPKEFVMKKISQ